jgi:hypothetical protein
MPGKGGGKCIPLPFLFLNMKWIYEGYPLLPWK